MSYTNIVILSFLNPVQPQDRQTYFKSQVEINGYQWPTPENRSTGFSNQPPGYYDIKRLPSSRGTIGGNPFHANYQGFHQDQLRGILAGWREDLQGRERSNSLVLERDVFVTTNNGKVQGFKVYSYDNPDPKSFYRPYHSNVDHIKGECSVFLGIPYALPPIFQGRFRPPRSPRAWELLQAVDFGPACPQPLRFTGAENGIRNVNEDCLYLNIYTPKTGAGLAQKYPVMIYIHGGDFVRGASNLFPAHILASFYGVVVITLNYRLGALGFLSTGDENSPGNYGILDQAMAINWVHNNIEFFNGDRNSITLFGPGAGAASAGLLMVAPKTRNIVTKVIAQSGSALADWALIQNKYRAQNTSRVFGNLLGCSSESSWKLVNCLRNGRSSFDLGNAEFSPSVGTFAWGPVFDKNFTVPADNWYDGWHEKDWKFLSDTPENLIHQNNFNRHLHYMTGITTQEAAFFISDNISLAPNYEIDKDFFYEKIRDHVFRYNYTLNPKGAFEAIKFMYTYWPDPNNTKILRDQYIKMLTDLHYTAPVDKMVKALIEQKVPVYMYVLNTTVEALNLPDWRKYPHDIEHYFLTGAPFMDVEFFPQKTKFKRDMWTENDRNMSHFFMQIFSNFAKYGNPTPQQVLGIYFDRGYPGEFRYLNINTTYNSSILCNYRQVESAFWYQYMPTVIGISVPKYLFEMEPWLEARDPLQIAFWSICMVCLLLILLIVICCIMWRSAKRQSERFGDEDLFTNYNEAEPDHNLIEYNIENQNVLENNHALQSRENIYNGQSSLSDSNSKRVDDQNSPKVRKFSTKNSHITNAPVAPLDKSYNGNSLQKDNFLTQLDKAVLKSFSNSDNEFASSQNSTPDTKVRTPNPSIQTHLIEGIPQTSV